MEKLHNCVLNAPYRVLGHSDLKLVNVVEVEFYFFKLTEPGIKFALHFACHLFAYLGTREECLPIFVPNALQITVFNASVTFAVYVKLQYWLHIIF